MAGLRRRVDALGESLPCPRCGQGPGGFAEPPESNVIWGDDDPDPEPIPPCDVCGRPMEIVVDWGEWTDDQVL